jgi:hypothetical protein
MATESPLISIGSQCTAAADLSGATTTLAGPNGSGQFLAVKLTGSRVVNLANAGGEAVLGILQNTPTLGAPADIGFVGVSKAVAGAAIAAGAELMTDTSARLITATSTNHRVALALEAATAAGQLISVVLGGAVFDREST